MRFGHAFAPVFWLSQYILTKIRLRARRAGTGKEHGTGPLPSATPTCSGPWRPPQNVDLRLIDPTTVPRFARPGISLYKLAPLARGRAEAEPGCSQGAFARKR